jgi:hypothetical protein
VSESWAVASLFNKSSSPVTNCFDRNVGLVHKVLSPPSSFRLLTSMVKIKKEKGFNGNTKNKKKKF